MCVCEWLLMHNGLSDFIRLAGKLCDDARPNKTDSLIPYLTVRGLDPLVTHQTSWLSKHSLEIAPDGSLHTLNSTFQLGILEFV